MKTALRTARLLALLLVLSALAAVSAGAPGGRPRSKDAVGCSRVYDGHFNDTHFAVWGACVSGGGGCYDCYYNTGGVLTECYEAPPALGAPPRAETRLRSSRFATNSTLDL